ncbi:RHS repeat domain-containing protein [Flavobacterium sp.]|uniref:RHS repeat domain-containing protein n=1 Tax=Flavobacterium sp. TaxID=239 RepID=UPI00391D6782
MAEQRGQHYYNSPYKFNGKELDEETGLYYYGARYYDPKVSIWLSVDPLAEKFPNHSPYNFCFNNPINFIDPFGMEPVEGGEDPNKLTGSSNLLIYINENPDGMYQKNGNWAKNKKLDVNEQKTESGDYDFIAVNNIDEIQGVLEGHYGKGNVPEMCNVVVRSHGAYNKDIQESHGPQLGFYISDVVHNPSASKGLIYLNSILSNDANLVFTACNVVQDCTGKNVNKNSQSLINNYSNFFLKGRIEVCI